MGDAPTSLQLGDLLLQLQLPHADKIYDSLELKDVGALRCVSRELRNWVDGSVRTLKVVVHVPEDVDEEPDIRVLTAPLCGILTRLRQQRWPRASSLNLTVFARAEAINGQDVTALVTTPLLLHPGAAAALSELSLHVVDVLASGILPLDWSIFPILSSFCPGLKSLSIDGAVELDSHETMQENSFRLLARLPHLSSLTLPGTAGLQHVGHLAAGLRELRIGRTMPYEVESEEEEEDGVPLRLHGQLCALQALTALSRLTLDVFEGFALDTEQSQVLLLRHMPRSVRELVLLLDGCPWLVLHLDAQGNCRDLHVGNGHAVAPCHFLHLPRIYRVLSRGGRLPDGARLRSLVASHIQICNRGCSMHAGTPLVGTELADVLALLRLCDSVQVGCVGAAMGADWDAVLQAVELLGAGCVRSLELSLDLDGALPPVQLQLRWQKQGAAGEEAGGQGASGAAGGGVCGAAAEGAEAGAGAGAGGAARARGRAPRGGRKGAAAAAGAGAARGAAAAAPPAPALLDVLRLLQQRAPPPAPAGEAGPGEAAGSSAGAGAAPAAPPAAPAGEPSAVPAPAKRQRRGGAAGGAAGGSSRAGSASAGRGAATGGAAGPAAPAPPPAPAVPPTRHLLLVSDDLPPLSRNPVAMASWLVLHISRYGRYDRWRPLTPLAPAIAVSMEDEAAGAAALAGLQRTCGRTTRRRQQLEAIPLRVFPSSNVMVEPAEEVLQPYLDADGGCSLAKVREAVGLWRHIADLPRIEHRPLYPMIL